MSTSSCSLCNDIAGTALKTTLIRYLLRPYKPYSTPPVIPALNLEAPHQNFAYSAITFGFDTSLVVMAFLYCSVYFVHNFCSIGSTELRIGLPQISESGGNPSPGGPPWQGSSRLLRDLRFQLIEVESEIGISIWDTESVPPEVANSVELAPLQPRIKDWSLIQAQLTCCISHHPICATNPYGKLPNSFRVIDVLRRQIVPFPRGQRFVALSYVWGANPNPKFHIATQSSFSSITAVGGLTSSEMPQTIEDAIKVCEHLGAVPLDGSSVYHPR